MKLKRLEQSGNKALRLLREKKLRSGLTFMINSGKLKPDQCFIEHPDGSIYLVALNRRISDFETIKKYTSEESNLIRKEFKLSPIHNEELTRKPHE